MSQKKDKKVVRFEEDSTVTNDDTDDPYQLISKRSKKKRRKKRIRKCIGISLLTISLLVLIGAIVTHMYGFLSTHWWQDKYNVYRSGFFQLCHFDNCFMYDSTSSFGVNFNISKTLLIAGLIFLWISMCLNLVGLILTYIKMSVGFEIVSGATCLISAIFNGFGIYMYTNYINNDATKYGHELSWAFYVVIAAIGVSPLCIPFLIGAYINSCKYSNIV